MAKRQRSTADMLQSATRAGAAIQKQDRAIEAQTQEARSMPATFPLDKILDRSSDTRKVKQEHVQELMESISVLGLLEPLVIDRKGRLLAGAHRRAAIYLLQEQKKSSYKKHFQSDLIPVRVIDFDAEKDPSLALQIEITENEKRRDYTPNEVRLLADTLREAGYVDLKGRPAKNQKALRPALELIVGKSLRTVRRYLNTETEKSVTNVRLSDDEKELSALKRLRSELIRWENRSLESEISELSALSKDVAKLVRRIDRQLRKLGVD